MASLRYAGGVQYSCAWPPDLSSSPLSDFRSDSVLHPVAVAFIELPLPIIHTFGIQVCIMAEVERSDNAVTGSWFSIRGQALPNQKNLLREALDIIAFFHHRDTSDVTQKGDSGG